MSDRPANILPHGDKYVASEKANMAGATILGFVCLFAAGQWSVPLGGVERMLVGLIGAIQFYRALTAYKQLNRDDPRP